MRNHRKRFGCSVFLLTAVIFAFIFKSGSAARIGRLLKTAASGFGASGPTITLAQDPSVSIPSLHSPCAVLVRLNDHSVLMQKQSEKKIYPASLTKMMTVIIAIENLPDLQQKIELSPSLFQPLYRADASMAGFQPGEKVREIDLLYGAMLPSGAECCIGLANKISGSEQEFAEKMNRKAKELGMTHTHFSNSTGLQDENHYTTVKDLSALLGYALQNQTFRDIFTSSRHSTAPTNKHPDGVTFQSTLFQNLEDQAIPGGEILGGKTGYTEEAGLCLASLARKNGQEYTLVTASAKGDHKSEQYDIDDACEVYRALGQN